MTSWMTPSPEDNEFGSPLPPPQAPVFNAAASKPRRRVLGVLLTLVLGFIGGLVGNEVSNNWDLSFGSGSSVQSSNSPLVTSEVSPDDASVGDTVIAQVANAMSDSVVTISSSIDDGMTTGEGTGTGVVLTADGEILTNAHVVADATEVTVRFAGETEPRMAKVLASDPGNDLALLKIDATDLKPATFAQPGTIRIGDGVIAIGYALDLDGGPTVTSGIVSALKRTIITESGALNGLIQTDAAISSGNSGGPLINLNGQVVGINTAVANGNSSTAANNIGFAIGVAEVQRVASLLRADAGGEVRAQGYLGISLGDRNDGGAGAVVSEVQADSPADKAGLKVKDIVLQINGQAITGQGALIAIVRDSAPGDVIKIKVERDDVVKDLTATLVARPKE